MNTRFEAGKCEIEQDAKIDKKDVDGMRNRFDRFLVPYFNDLPRSESRQNATTMVKGLLSDLKRKNTEPIAYRFGQQARALQLFVGTADWDHQVVLDRIAKETAKLIGEDDAILAFDPQCLQRNTEKGRQQIRRGRKAMPGSPATTNSASRVGFGGN